MATTPMFSPDGTLGDIPQERVADATKAGFKPGQELVSPKGVMGVVPMDRAIEAMRAGYMPKSMASMPGAPPSRGGSQMQPSNLGIALGSEHNGVANPQQPSEQFAIENPDQQATLLGAAAIGAAGTAGAALAPAAIPAIKTLARAHPIISTMLASEAISQSRKIPYLGKMIPPYSEMIPMLLGGKGSPAEPTAPPETMWDAPAAVKPPVPRTAPAWQTQQQLPEGFNPTLGNRPQSTTPPWQGSTPEEVQAQLQRMANRASSSRAVGQPADTTQVQSIPVKPIQPPFPGPKTYDVVRGEDPFTHPNAPPSWKFDQDYSTNVKQYGYHPDSQTLSVQYKRGSVYQFKATQQQFNEMQKAPSAGGYLHDVIEPSQTRGVGRHIGTVQDRSAGQQAKSALEQARGQQ